MTQVVESPPSISRPRYCKKESEIRFSQVRQVIFPRPHSRSYPLPAHPVLVHYIATASLPSPGPSLWLNTVSAAELTKYECVLKTKTPVVKCL
jgi:hypothetical protein